MNYPVTQFIDGHIYNVRVHLKLVKKTMLFKGMCHIKVVDLKYSDVIRNF